MWIKRPYTRKDIEEDGRMRKDNKFNPDKIQQVIEEVEKEYNKVLQW